LNESYIDAHHALSLNELGDHQRAADLFERALQTLPCGFHRDRGVYLARAARAYAGAREFDQAATLGIQSLSIATETRSGRTATELARLGNELGTARSGAVNQFRDRLRASTISTPAPATTTGRQRS
jgi:tetratricopeptide (TPR) repeat protein